MMKTIGLIGGMSWQSTVTYYQILNRAVAEQLGGMHSAKCLLYSVDFATIETLQREEKWDEAAYVLIEAAQALERGGADFLLICTNTMHKVADEVQAAIGIPLLHIAEVTASALMEAGIARVALLGTRYTMQQDFYKNRLVRHGIDVLLPDEAQQTAINTVIFDELCRGIISDESRRYFDDVIRQLADKGSQGVILGCTEIGLLVQQADVPVPVFDTTELHARRAALQALA